MTITFAGYAALFDIPDAARDVIRRGAFRRATADAAKQIPLHWQHRPDQQIGVVEHVAEDDRGLRVVARIDNPDGRAGTMLSEGKISGLSFGYRALRTDQSAGGRVLHEVDLFEVSLVTHPLQHGARIHLVA